MESNDRAAALKALNRFATEIKSHEEVETVCEATVEAAGRILDFDNCVINLERDGYMKIVAISEGLPESGARKMAIDEGMVGKTFRTGETYLVSDIAEWPEANPQGPYGSAISVPLGDHGVFQTVSEEVEAFDETDRELAELLAAHCTSALDRIERTEALQEQTRQLERQNERLDRFAGIVSHDLQTPLSTMRGYLELARETGEPEHFEKCETAIDRMEALTDDLLTIAREGSVSPAPEGVELAAVAEAAWNRVDAETATLQAPDDAELRADRDRLLQILENLFRNAADHAGTGVTVTVGTLEEGFYVADDGPGIPADQREQMLEPGVTTSDQGTGFGLSIVETLAEAHGWSLDLTESDAGGARFEFTGVETPGS